MDKPINFTSQSVNMYIVYGIPNCNTVKKTLTWLDKHKVKYSFHNYKTEGIAKTKLKIWSQQKGWESFFNKKSSTWRELDNTMQEKIKSEKSAIDLMAEKTSIIKRPIIEEDGNIISIGFDEKLFNEIF
jgi:Spx/MgsR family transcriptional regulator